MGAGETRPGAFIGIAGVRTSRWSCSKKKKPPKCVHRGRKSVLYGPSSFFNLKWNLDDRSDDKQRVYLGGEGLRRAVQRVLRVGRLRTRPSE